LRQIKPWLRRDEARFGLINRRTNVHLRNLLRTATPEHLATGSSLKSESAMPNNCKNYASENPQHV
jgi:hypothetical protein